MAENRDTIEGEIKSEQHELTDFIRKVFIVKILITSEWYSPAINGVVTSVLNLQTELKKLGHEVKVLTLSATARSYEKDGVTYFGSFGTGKIYPGTRVALFRGNKFLEELIEWGPDIIHSQCEFSTFHIARQISKELDIPIVHTYHTVYEDYTHYFSPNKKWGTAMVVRFTRRVLNSAECVIAPTEKVRSLLLGYGVKRQIYVVPTGINLENFVVSVSTEEKRRLRDSLGIPFGSRVMTFVGRLAKEKNLEEIFTYLTRYISETGKKDITLLVVGDGPHRSFLEQYASDLGVSDNVVFAGMVKASEVAKYYQLGEVFVSASSSETQGLTYIEALANGVPALCRKDPSLEDVIREGENGWQYENYEEFVEKLERMLSNEILHKRMAENARAGAVQKFSSIGFAKKVEKIYLNTMDFSLAGLKKSEG